MKSNKKFWLLCAVLIAVISLVILSLSALYTAAKAIRTSKETRVTDETKKTEDTQKSLSYTIREYRGRIGVFSESGDLLEIIDTPIIALPQSDRDKLSLGITVRNESELSSFREDYS